MKLYLVRHGPAENDSPTGKDVDRALTPDGRERVRLIAVELAKRGEAPKRIIASPLKRARETAAIVAKVVGLERACEESDELRPGGNGLSLVRELAADNARKVMLVGHEPDMSSLALELLGDWSRDFTKAMVLGLRVRNEEAGLEVERRFLLEPKTRRWVEL